MPEIKEKEYPQRTIPQNRALHLYFTHVAEALNDAGYDVKKALEILQTYTVPWNGHIFKEGIWRPIQKAAIQKDSTKDLTTVEIDEVYDIVNKILSEKFGITVEFPSYFSGSKY